MANDDISIKLNFDDSDFQSRIQAAQSAIDKMSGSTNTTAESLNGLEGSAKKTGQAFGQVEQKAKAAGEGVNNASKHIEEAKEHMGSLATEAYYASYGFGLLGEQIGGAASQASNFFQLAESFKELSPAVFGLLSALTAAVLAFEGLGAVVGKVKDAIDDFAKDQSQLVSINALIKNQGGAWKENSARVNEYAEKLAMAGTFAKGDILSGMQRLLTYGLSVNDAMRTPGCCNGPCQS